MAAKKVWAVYEMGSTYKGPLVEVLASSERGAVNAAMTYHGVPRNKLYAVPLDASAIPFSSWSDPRKKRSHSTKTTKSASEKLIAKMTGRHVKSDWRHLVDGEIVKWEPFSAGGIDVLVKDVPTGHQGWYASYELKPIDGKGPLPSRKTVQKLREAEMADDMKKIGERWAKEPPPTRIRR